MGATEARIDVDGSGAIESEEFIVPLSRWVTWLGIYPAPGPGLVWSTQGSYIFIVIPSIYVYVCVCFDGDLKFKF